MKSSILILLCVFSLEVCSQSLNYSKEFINVLDAGYSVGYSEKRIASKSKRKNSHNFLEIGYFINANNIRGNKEASHRVIQNIINYAPKDNNQYKWIVTEINNNDRNVAQKGKEFMLFEGYMFRYIAEFQYQYPDMTLADTDFVESVFSKWYNESVRRHGDASSLYGLRLHMGSHWATVASYLVKLNPSKEAFYRDFIDVYDRQLKKSLKIREVNGKKCYVWNSTYVDKFVNNLKKRKNEVIVQDVTHGNHVVQYVVDSYRLGFGTWTKQDLEMFANTLKEIIWKDKKRPSDFVDGSFSDTGSHTGWKQSDGWMKLMVLLDDRELFNIYDNYYRANSKQVNTFFPNIQYFAVMEAYQRNNL